MVWIRKHDLYFGLNQNQIIICKYFLRLFLLQDDVSWIGEDSFKLWCVLVLQLFLSFPVFLRRDGGMSHPSAPQLKYMVKLGRVCMKSCEIHSGTLCFILTMFLHVLHICAHQLLGQRNPFSCRYKGRTCLGVGLLVFPFIYLLFLEVQ